MKYIVSFLLLSISLNLFSQSKIAETIKFKVTIVEEEMPNATVKIKGASYESTTDINGEANLLIPFDKNEIVIAFSSARATFKIIHPADFVLVDLDNKRASIFYRKKRIKKVRINISEY